MNDDVHQRFMGEALALADEAATRGEVPVGAVVVQDGVVIGRGYNLRETDQDPTAHAEVLALRAAAKVIGSWRLERCQLYVTLEPCPMCAGALVQSRIQTVIFGCTDPKGGFMGTLADLSAFPGLNHRIAVVKGVEEQACRDRLTAFFRALRKKS